MHELVASVFVGAEEVEGSAAWREEDGVAFAGSAESTLYGVVEVVGVNDIQPERAEMLPQFLVVESHKDQRVAFLADELVYLAVVVAFVFAAEDKHGGGGHGLQRVPAGVDIRRFGVVDEAHAAHGGDILQSVRYSGELLQALADDAVLDVQDLRGERGSHRVELVVLTLQAQLLHRHFQRLGAGIHHKVVVVNPCGIHAAYFVGRLVGRCEAEGVERCSRTHLLYLAVEHGVL